MPAPERLFTARFALMFGFSFTVFLSAFQLLPTAPFHILALGGTSSEAGLFLAFLTYASALCAPFMGGVADRLGKRRILFVCSLAIAVFSALYAVVPAYQVILALVPAHGLFWAGLLSASGAYITEIIPPTRRAEGLSYWGFASIFAVAIAPSLGLWVFERGGWTALCVEALVLNLIMALIAWRLPSDQSRGGKLPARLHDMVEWRVMVLGVTLFLYAFSYGGITSFTAIYAEQLGIAPKALYFTAFAVAIIVTRPFIARYADQVGHERVVLPCLVAVAAGVTLLALAESRTGFLVSACVFGTGFGSAYPIFVAHLMKKVAQDRRGATFGALIGAFDVGIGTGSMAIGWLGEHYGYGRAFGVAAALAATSIPYYAWARRSQSLLRA
ncbi:MAG TPA: MFS transporter [Vicinamibacterales bacterium]|nr:MFS transporter [Vicinamibacterales bacterium]